jgi:hypothetical protein
MISHEQNWRSVPLKTDNMVGTKSEGFGMKFMTPTRQRMKLEHMFPEQYVLIKAPNFNNSLYDM